MPACFWRRTTSATDWVSVFWNAASLTLPVSRWALASMRSSGRGRLPAWLVRMRSLLLSMGVLPSASLELGRLALLGEGPRGLAEILGKIKLLRRAHEHHLAAE